MKDHLGAQLDAYMDGRLEAADKTVVENHLRTCLTCKAELKTLQELSEHIENAQPAAAIPSSFKAYWGRLLGRHKEINTMTAIQRLKRVVESNIHAAIDSMEEPAKMIKQLLREMEAAIHAAREEVIEAIVLEKGFTHRYQEASMNIKKWEARATLALKNGREDLAREALKEQMLLEALTQDLHEECDKQKARASELKSALKNLERQFNDLKRRKALWLSQVQNSLSQSPSHQSYQTAYGELSRQLEITREQTIIDATYNDVYETEKLETTFNAMEETQNLEQRLTVLKQRLQN